ncbi:hypothetical protein LO771_29230 [Streptacidiphilus sp. ASG 303]|uniref:hypothetical protein n=1 Tax=Streptacidiphilus sp. ASG 303 TaxID=2896847 RepID=UPI001E638D19|nr:hypothetical protein [Streptacidiphilus sp. ASG 303]MCD0486356.1 hypothetical protein [Streptacidiphilus sp. ASG 303]
MNLPHAAAALCSVWLGALVAISFLEAPLKFRAPGMTVPVALSVGRLVFAALNRMELLLLAAAVAAGLGCGRAAVLALPAVLLLAQVLLLRPRMDRRAVRVIAGEPVPRSRLHVAYVAAEGAKAVVLVAAAVLLGTS